MNPIAHEELDKEKENYDTCANNFMTDRGLTTEEEVKTANSNDK